MPPTPRNPGPEPTDLDNRITRIEDRLDQLVGTVERIASLELPTPDALDELSVRLQALEDKPDPVSYQPDDGQNVRRPPAQKLCGECGAVEGQHFDDCQTGRGAAAMPKTAVEREQVLADRGALNRA